MMNHHLLKSWLAGAASAALVATAAFAQGAGGYAQQPQNRPAAPSQSQSQPQAEPSQRDSAAPAARSQQKSAAPSDDQKAQTKSGQRPSGSAQKSQDRQTRDKAAQDDQKATSRSQAQQDRTGQDTKSSTTGQGSTQQSRDAAPRSRDSARDTQTRDQAAQPAREGSRGAARLSEQQRTRISQSVARLGVDPVRNATFSVAVGTTVPRSVRLHAVPSAIVDIYPHYRGYEFAIVEEEIVIIQPRTRKIVAVLPYGGGSAKAARASTRKSIRLSDRDRATIRRTVVTRETTGVAAPQGQVVVGERLPRSVVIERFPDTVYRQVPAIRSYHYVVRDRDVYVVDPRERRVIEVIE